MKDALKLALEALEYASTGNRRPEVIGAAITAIKQACSAPVQEPVCIYPRCSCNSKDFCDPKRQQALDKMAENARELGLDYEPWNPNDTAHRPGGLPQDFIKHEVENEGDWSEWVNPNSEQYFMKCCDCGLVHEMQFNVAKYSEGDECEFVADTNLQAVFRARRATPPSAQRQWVGLTDEEVMSIAYQAGFEIHEDYDTPDADPNELHWWSPDYERCDDALFKLRDLINAKLKEKNT